MGKEKSDPGSAATAAASGILIAIVVGLVLLIKALYPVDLPGTPSPNYIDMIFNNRLVIWAARLLLVSAAAVMAFGGVFIAVSIGIRMKNGHWLRKAGPFEVSETELADIESQLQKWKRAAEAGKEEVGELSERLEESDELIKQLQKELGGKFEPSVSS